MATADGNKLPDSAAYFLFNLPLWTRIVAILGFPTVVACVLLGVLLGWVKSPLTEIVVLQQKEVDVLQSIIQTSLATRRESMASIEYQNMLLRTLCRSISKNEQQSLACEPYYRGYEEPQQAKDKK